MSGVKQRLYDYLVSNGVDPTLAESAADRCAKALLTDGAIGLAAGTALGVLIGRNPVVGTIIGTATGVLGAGVGVGAATMSTSCEEVRNAALDMSGLHL